MNTPLRIPLQLTADQTQRLKALQSAFAQACNAIAPVVQSTRTWNRVALHHLTYKSLRAQFPALGSQLSCNVIYSVSRACRLVYQHPASPFHLGRLGNRPLPLIRFSERSPVYFDRHTLSLKGGQLSMFTLDGRMRFQLALRDDQEARFHQQKLREIVLAPRQDGTFELCFWFSADSASTSPSPDSNDTDKSDEQELPDYVLVEAQP